MYWFESPDVFSYLAAESIRRETFEHIMRCLHFADNMQMTEDRFYKVVMTKNYLTLMTNLMNFGCFTASVLHYHKAFVNIMLQ